MASQWSLQSLSIPVPAPWVHLEIGKLTLVTRTPYLISAAVKTPDPGSITEDLRGLVSDLSERIISHIIRTTHPSSMLS